MKQNRIRITFVLTIALLFFSLHPWETNAETKAQEPGKLLVGAANMPPFSMKMKNGKWEGFSIDLWKSAAKELGIEFEIREYRRIRDIVNALQNEEIDLTTAVAVTEANETMADLSHAFYRSGLGIAVLADPRRPGWFNYVKGLASADLLKVLIVLLLLSLISGIIIWLLETRKNSDMFGAKFSKGFGQGFWWALVTMTTVGYGDKAPKTIAGRIVAVIWMLFSIILIISYTAVITTSVAVDELSGRVNSPRDLPDVRVGVLNQSETFEYLEREGIPLLPFKSIQDGLQALIENKVDAFVDDESQLKYLVKSEFPGQLHVLAETFGHYYVSMAVPSGSQFREPLNRTLAKLMEQEEWTRLQNRYLGSSH